MVVFARRGRLFVRFLTGRRGYQGGFSQDGEVITPFDTVVSCHGEVVLLPPPPAETLDDAI